MRDLPLEQVYELNLLLKARQKLIPLLLELLIFLDQFLANLVVLGPHLILVALAALHCEFEPLQLFLHPVHLVILFLDLHLEPFGGLAQMLVLLLISFGGSFLGL